MCFNIELSHKCFPLAKTEIMQALFYSIITPVDRTFYVSALTLFLIQIQKGRKQKLIKS